MDRDIQNYSKKLYTQLAESHGKVVYTYTTHLKMVDRLIKKNHRIKYAQIAFSAISTGGFLGAIITNETAFTCIGGLFSTILLALNLYFKDFNLDVEIARHLSVANKLWDIRESYVSLMTDFSLLSEDEIRSKRDGLQSRTFEVYKDSPKTDSKSYAEAQKALKDNDEQFFTTKELEHLLPSHLRERLTKEK